MDDSISDTSGSGSGSDSGSDSGSGSGSGSSDVLEYFSDDNLIHKINNLKIDENTKNYSSDTEMYIGEIHDNDGTITLLKEEAELIRVLNLKMDTTDNYFAK